MTDGVGDRRGWEWGSVGKYVNSNGAYLGKK